MEAEDTDFWVAEDTGLGAEADVYPRNRPAREAHERGAFMRCMPVKCTPVRKAQER
jgi:hypothetical protein